MTKRLGLTLGAMLMALLMQAQVGNQFLTKIINWNAYVHLPGDYDQNPTKSYPVIVFIPGIGEIGTNASLVLLYGPGYYIARGATMEFNVNGQIEKPIVISLQPIGSWPSATDLESRFADIISRWRVDTTRFYTTGLSMGGWAIMNHVTTNARFANRIAAMVAMSAPTPDIGKMKYFAMCNGKWWGFEGSNDYRSLDRIRDTMNTAVAGSARYTRYNGGHCCWNTWYNPDWRENDVNIYEWMLQQKKPRYTYLFNGTGSYSSNTNWWSNLKPPTVLKNGMEIGIYCVPGGICQLAEPIILERGSNMVISKTSLVQAR